MISKKHFWISLILVCFSLVIFIINFTFGGMYAKIGSPNNSPIFIFAFFTIQSNLLVLFLYLLLLISNLFNNKKSYDILNHPYIRGVIAFWITVTGIVFTFILYPVYWITPKSAPVNFVGQLIQISFHMIIPLYVVIDSYFIFKNDKKFKWYIHFLLCYIYPIMYLFIVLIVGNFTHSYPYFFVDPYSKINKAIGGPVASIILWIVFLSLFFAIVELGVLYRMDKNLGVKAIYLKLFNKKNK